MKLDQNGYNLIASFEGLSLVPYKDSVGIPTIGYGNTYYPDGRKVKMTDPKITKAYAMELLKVTADKFAISVWGFTDKPLTQNKFNALVSFAYNVGIGNYRKSTLLKKVKSNPNDHSIIAELLKWNKAGGKVIPGLTNRRKKEADIYFS